MVIFLSSFSAPSTALAEVEQYRKSLIRGRGVDGEGDEDEEEQRKKIEIERLYRAHLPDKHHIEYNK
jgi:hypothetical protein